jgi:hypothetical protein
MSQKSLQDQKEALENKLHAEKKTQEERNKELVDSKK